ncbi:PWWP domain-containing protein [Mycena chlorophos]|uniref:PWWP domain-containing protein n=1 Tax=Mycena chlorophos TaxID=658473 RepID=A0A8H6RXX7_MYCCL|nr:PWWP domain-containing protein [Mycena chlorophos]
MVMDPKHAPPNIRDAQPVGWRRHTPYAVRFFPRGDYTWIANNYIVPLTSEGIAEYQAASADPTRKRRSGTGLGRVDLGYAYEAASRPEAWEKELEQILKDARKEAEKKKKASKVGVDMDKLKVYEPAKVGQKRKRTKPKAKSKAVAKTTKPKPKPKEEELMMMIPDVAVLEEEEEEEEEEAGPSKKKPRKEAAKKGTSKAVGRKAKELLEADPVALEIKEWRNKLQKTFLKQSGLPPKDTEMPDMDDLFTEIEEYDEMSVEYLAFSKINKVMRHVHLLEPERVPRDAEFRFRDRAKALVDRWTEMLNEDKGEGDGGEADLTMME